jgi:hypothetical protein
MEIPNQIRVRLLLTFDKLTFKKFYWFEAKDNDFYWGSAYKSARSEEAMTKINGTKATITVPDDFDKLPKLHGKYSYHESGTVHYKTLLDNGVSIYNEQSKWHLKGDIKKPVRFYTIFSRTLRHYGKVINNPTKNKSYALALNFDPKHADNRVYFEFFLSPEGTFNIPETLIKVDKPITNVVTHTVSKNLILVLRYAVMGNMGDWHPDKEIAIMPNYFD